MKRSNFYVVAGMAAIMMASSATSAQELSPSEFNEFRDTQQSRSRSAANNNYPIQNFTPVPIDKGREFANDNTSATIFGENFFDYHLAY